jgi:cupin fold WbuC family metalloprotein
MSRRYGEENRDPLALVPFGEGLLDEVAEAARGSARKRSIIRFHEHGDAVQRMLNALEPESYVRPHRHPVMGKREAFVALRGSLLVVRFGDEGRALEGVVVSAEGPVKGLEVPEGAWHSILSLESGTVMFEVIQGPYDAETHKEFAPWAPPEEDEAAGAAYMRSLRAMFEGVIPQVAARDIIEAEEDEIC